LFVPRGGSGHLFFHYIRLNTPANINVIALKNHLKKKAPINEAFHST
jgi:hypothetical protein